APGSIGGRRLARAIGIVLRAAPPARSVRTRPSPRWPAALSPTRTPPTSTPSATARQASGVAETPWVDAAASPVACDRAGSTIVIVAGAPHQPNGLRPNRGSARAVHWVAGRPGRRVAVVDPGPGHDGSAATPSPSRRAARRPPEERA